MKSSLTAQAQGSGQSGSEEAGSQAEIQFRVFADTNLEELVRTGVVAGASAAAAIARAEVRIQPAASGTFLAAAGTA